MAKPNLVVLALIPAALAARAAAADVTGTYTGTWGDTTLRQDGDHVTGAYAYDDGRIDGELDGDTLRFAWTEDSGSGRGVFQVLPDGSMQGTWGSGDSDSDGGAWVLSPSSAAIASVGPADGAWTWGLRVPWNVQFTPHNISMGAIGATLDVGKHLARSRWYLGGSAEVELEVDMMPPDSTALDGPAAWARLRLGGEARYYLGDGTASVSVNDGPEIPVPRHDWIGLRAGAESIDELAHVGQFADLTYGWDADLGGTAVGMTLTGGVSRDPSAAFPGNAQNDPAATDWQGNPTAEAMQPTPAMYVAPYIAMGIHLQF